MARQQYRYSIRIPFQDIDAAGVVFFAHLFRYAHEAYEGFMTDIGHSLVDVIATGRYLLPLVHADADYRQPIRHGETITIDLAVKKLGESSFTLHYLCFDAEGNISAEVETVHVVMHPENKRPMPVPRPLSEALSQYL